MLTHYGFSIYLIDDTVAIADWCNLKIIMRATADLGDVYRLVYTTELYETHISTISTYIDESRYLSNGEDYYGHLQYYINT